MKRPLLWTVFFGIAGILGGQYWKEGIVPLFLCALFFSLALLYFKRAKEFLCLPFFFLLFFVLVQGSLTFPAAAEKICRAEDDVIVRGYVTDLKYNDNNEISTLGIESEEVIYDGNKTEEKLKIRVIVLNGADVEQGDEVMIRGTAAMLGFATNPGGFSELYYYRARGYDCKIFADSVENLGVSRKNTEYYMGKLREKVNNVYDNVFPVRYAGIVKAIVTGDKNLIDDTIGDIFRLSGIFHLMAISGLHVSILTLLLYQLLNGLLHINRKGASLITVLFLLFYMAFTGSSVSTVRAVIMGSVILLGRLIDRDGDDLNSISLAAILLLLYEPLYLYDIGFQLSFMTVTGIVLGAKRLKKNKKLPEEIKNTLGIPLIASLVSFPLLAHHFYYIPAIGILVNILIAPFVSALLVFSLLCGLAGLFSISLAAFLAGVPFVILSYFELVCVFFTACFPAFSTGSIPPVTVFLCYALLLAVYCYRKKDWKRKTAVTVCVLALLAVVFGNRFFWKRDTVAFLDVGQGDCAVIKTYDGKCFMIDGGGKAYKDLGENTGVQIVIPFLEYSNVQRVDALFLTHMDADHALGALEVMASFPVSKVVISDYDFEENEIYAILKEIAKEKKIPVVSMKKDDILEINEEMTIKCLYPVGEKLFFDGDDNHGSLVLKVTDRELSFLFTGDITKEDERVLLDMGEDMEADVIKAAHHGSKYSNSELFLLETKAKAAVISSGRNNVYGHPAPEVLETLHVKEITYYNTAHDGAVIMKTDGNEIEIKTMPEGSFYERIKEAFKRKTI